MFSRKLILVFISICASSSVNAHAQSITFVKVADEWGTIQSAGPRTGPNGIRFWNIQGGDTEFSSAGTLRFYMQDLVSQLNTQFGAGGWQIDNVTLVTEQQNAAFTANGAVNIFHVTNDDVGFTNGEADGSPGDFSQLGFSPLTYDNTAVAKTIGADLGTVTLINEYNFIAVGTFDNADVFGLEGNSVDPAGAIDAGPNYGLDFPEVTASPVDEVANFNAEIAHDSGAWNEIGLSTIADDIEDGNDALSFIFASGDDSVAATYKGNFFIDSYPPRIYIEASATTQQGVLGDYNGNNVVDAADYVVWRNGGPLLNESETPGSTTQEDYDFWVSRFGATSGGGNVATASARVPEPASALLLLTAVCGLRLGFSRRR